MSWEKVIGLEIHIRLNTKSKLFSSSSTQYGKHQNTQASFLDLGMPGTLPLVNKAAVDMAIIFGLAVDAQISKDSFFARKNYFYPDLSKGYQISQSTNPIVQKGRLDIQTSKGSKTICIERAHLEEDAGKSVHGYVPGTTSLDFNRAGTTLLEVVTYPDFRSATEVDVFLKKMHRLVKYLNICDGNMQEGSFKCDVNLSARLRGQSELGTRVEMKNINSFKFIYKSIEYEFARQISVLESGGKVVQETRLYDADMNETRSMRTKEDAFDYRYFPDPDLSPLKITDDYIQKIKEQMPLMLELRQRLYSKYLDDQQIEFLLSNSEVANYYDQLVKKIDYKLAYIWLTTYLMPALNKLEKKCSVAVFSVEKLIEVVQAVEKEIISQKAAKQVMTAYLQNSKPINTIIDELGLKQVCDKSSIRTLVQGVIASNAQQAADFKAGKIKLLGFFVGQVMKASKGKISPKQVNQIVQEELNKQLSL